MTKKIISTVRAALVLAGGLAALSGCGKGEALSGGEYRADEVSAVHMEADTWNISMALSSDDKIRVAFAGDVSKGDTPPKAQVQEGTLQVVQEQGTETLGDKIAFGKKGEITLYLPEKSCLPITIDNGSGDIRIDRVSAQDFHLENNSGYAVLSDFTAEKAQITSRSGDVTWKGGETADISMEMESGYGTIKDTVFDRVSASAGSGEINISGAGADTDIQIQTGSGDISLSYETNPANLAFQIWSGSKDVSVKLPGAEYLKETEDTRQGTAGAGKYTLEIASDSGTVVVKG